MSSPAVLPGPCGLVRAIGFTPLLLLPFLFACDPPGASRSHESGAEAVGVEQVGGTPAHRAGAPRNLDWTPIPGADDRQARRDHFLVGPEALAEEIRSGTDLVVLEVGEDATLFEAEGRVAGARFLPWEAVALRRDGIPNRIPPIDALEEALAARGVGEETRIVLYDRGAGLRAGRAWAVLDYAGLGHRTRLLDGQLAGWKGSGGSVETGPLPEVAPARLVLRPRPELLVDGDRLADLVWVRERHGHLSLPGLHLLDARPPEEFRGEVPGDEVRRPGHIPGARNLPWRTTAGSDDAPFLLETDALLALFRQVGVEEGDRILTYCRTGGQAGYLHFVARMLGFDVRFYDDSFVAWSQRPERWVQGGDGIVQPPLTPGAETIQTGDGAP